MDKFLKLPIKKIIQIRCSDCNGIGFVKREEVKVYKKNSEEEENDVKINLPPYKECDKCDSLGYRVE